MQKTQAAGDQLKEASAINKSLTNLGLVMRSLVEVSKGKHCHVHYRDSKLTHILKVSMLLLWRSSYYKSATWILRCKF